jgi:hypothetical protein
MAFRMNNWSDPLDDELINKHQINISLIPAGRDSFFAWLNASLISLILSYIPNSLLSLKYIAFASNKRSWQLVRKLETERKAYDHIVSHNLGALYPAFYWARKTKASFSFDVEDFHPEETIVFQPHWEKMRRYRLMKELLPHCSNITAASPLIAKETESLLESKKIKVIQNSFFGREFIEPKRNNKNDPLKLVWFSQKISKGRGLDLILDIYQNLRSDISITLIGSIDEDFFNDHLKGTGIEIIKPLPQEKLHKLLSKFDIGLLLEKHTADFNRNICLTNKQFAYLQSGLYIVATNTLAHSTFFKDYPKLASVIDQNADSLQRELESLIKRKDSLREESNERYEFSKRFSFEHESQKLKLEDL